MPSDDLDRAIEESHAAYGEIVRGNPEPFEVLFSLLAAISLRVTSTFRLEDGTWKLVHRHADPITTAQSADSIIEKPTD